MGTWMTGSIRGKSCNSCYKCRAGILVPFLCSNTQEWVFHDNAGVTPRLQLNNQIILDMCLPVQTWLFPIGIGQVGGGVSGVCGFMLNRRYVDGKFLFPPYNQCQQELGDSRAFYELCCKV